MCVHPLQIFVIFESTIRTLSKYMHMVNNPKTPSTLDRNSRNHSSFYRTVTQILLATLKIRTLVFMKEKSGADESECQLFVRKEHGGFMTPRVHE